MTDEGLNVEGIVNLADQFGGLIDNRDIVVFQRQVTGDVEADLARAADNDLHDTLTLRGRTAFWMPRSFNFRCNAARSIPTKIAVLLILPLNRVR